MQHEIREIELPYLSPPHTYHLFLTGHTTPVNKLLVSRCLLFLVLHTLHTSDTTKWIPHHPPLIQSCTAHSQKLGIYTSAHIVDGLDYTLAQIVYTLAHIVYTLAQRQCSRCLYFGSACCS